MVLIRSSAQNSKPMRDGIPINKTNLCPFFIELTKLFFSVIGFNLDNVLSKITSLEKLY